MTLITISHKMEPVKRKSRLHLHIYPSASTLIFCFSACCYRGIIHAPIQNQTCPKGIRSHPLHHFSSTAPTIHLFFSSSSVCCWLLSLYLQLGDTTPVSLTPVKYIKIPIQHLQTMANKHFISVCSKLTIFLLTKSTQGGLHQDT